jgi:hypothetical protein
MADNRAHVVSFDESPLYTNSPINSEKYNDIINSLKTSAIRAINRSRDLSTKMTNWNKALVAENEYLGSKIRYLYEWYNKLPVVSSEAVVTGYDPVISSAGMRLDNIAGQATIDIEPGRKWSKVVRYTDINGKRRPSRDTSISLDGVTKSYTDDIYNILDGRSDTFWLLDTTRGVQHTLVIQFPASIRPYVNALSLTAFPAFCMRIDGVTLLQANSGSKNITPEGIEATSMGGIDVHFAPVSWGNQVTITFTALGSVVGMSNLDMFLIDYLNEGEVTYEVTSFENDVFTHIDEIDLLDSGLFGATESDGIYNRSEEMEITARVGTTLASAESTAVTPQTIRGEQPTTLNPVGTGKTASDKFWITIKLKKYNGQTPTFRSAKVTYRS